MDTPDPSSSAWAAVAAALAAPLAAAAGPGAHPVSIALDLAGAAEGPLVCRAWVERGTRTLVFLGAEARTAQGGLAAAATAVFRRG